MVKELNHTSPVSCSDDAMFLSRSPPLNHLATYHQGHCMCEMEACIMSGHGQCCKCNCTSPSSWHARCCTSGCCRLSSPFCKRMHDHIALLNRLNRLMIKVCGYSLLHALNYNHQVHESTKQRSSFKLLSQVVSRLINTAIATCTLLPLHYRKCAGQHVQLQSQYE